MLPNAPNTMYTELVPARYDGTIFNNARTPVWYNSTRFLAPNLLLSRSSNTTAPTRQTGRLHPLDRWCRTLAHTPRIPASLLEPLARAHVQLAIQLWRRFLAMDEVAEAAAHAALATIEAATGFAEIGDGGQFAVDGATGVPATVERVAGFLAVFLVLEAHVDVADEIWEAVVLVFGSAGMDGTRDGTRGRQTYGRYCCRIRPAPRPAQTGTARTKCPRRRRQSASASAAGSSCSWGRRPGSGIGSAAESSGCTTA